LDRSTGVEKIIVRPEPSSDQSEPLVAGWGVRPPGRRDATTMPAAAIAACTSKTVIVPSLAV
jgi:hypothetical protein